MRHKTPGVTFRLRHDSTLERCGAEKRCHALVHDSRCSFFDGFGCRGVPPCCARATSDVGKRTALRMVAARQVEEVKRVAGDSEADPLTGRTWYDYKPMATCGAEAQARAKTPTRRYRRRQMPIHEQKSACTRQRRSKANNNSTWAL